MTDAGLRPKHESFTLASRCRRVTVRVRILVVAAAFLTVAGLGFLLGYGGWAD